MQAYLFETTGDGGKGVGVCFPKQLGRIIEKITNYNLA